MKLYSSVFSLTMAGLAVATPVPAHLDIRADNYWFMNGFGNPNCKGSFLWGYQGTGNVCINVPTMAASVDFGTSGRKVEVGTINYPTCGLGRAALVAGPSDATTNEPSPTVQVIEVKGDGDSGLQKRANIVQRCMNSKDGILAFSLRFL